MPKIKVKNIPVDVRDRFCSKVPSCSECLFHLKKRCVTDIGTYTMCMIDSFYDPKETVVELSEKDFPTNREWLESLSDEDLAALMTTGLAIHGGKYDGFKITSSLITDKESMVDWLSKPCGSLMEEEL